MATQGEILVPTHTKCHFPPPKKVYGKFMETNGNEEHLIYIEQYTYMLCFGWLVLNRAASYFGGHVSLVEFPQKSILSLGLLLRSVFISPNSYFLRTNQNSRYVSAPCMRQRFLFWYVSAIGS